MRVRTAWIVGGVIGLAAGLGGALAVEARGQQEANAILAPRVVSHAKFVKSVEQRRAADREVRRLRATLRHQPSVQEALTLASIVYRIDRDDLSSTAWCESRHNPHARNGQYRGIMQLGDGFRAASPFFPALSPESAYANIMAAAQVISVQGYRQWSCAPGGRYNP